MSGTLENVSLSRYCELDIENQFLIKRIEKIAKIVKVSSDQALILGVIASDPNKVLYLEELVSVIWPEVKKEYSVNSLRRAIQRIRYKLDRVENGLGEQLKNCYSYGYFWDGE